MWKNAVDASKWRSEEKIGDVEEQDDSTNMDRGTRETWKNKVDTNMWSSEEKSGEVWKNEESGEM